MHTTAPRRLDRTRRDGFDHLIKTQPTATVGEIIDGDTLVYEEGIPKLGYFVLPPVLLRDIRHVVRHTKPQKSSRTDGLPTQSTIYGSMPRNKLRNDYCRYTAASRGEKKFFAIMNHACELLCDYYERYFPESYRTAMAEVGEVQSDWRHNRTPFQTININVNHAIKYHRDNGNFRGAHSTVLIVKENIDGGELTIPEWDITLSQRDGAFTIFDGQSLIHGVLPIKRRRPDGYRASIVFYSMSALKNCYPYQDEIDRLAAREKSKSVIRYSIENKKELIRMNRGALAKINSPYLKWIENDPTDLRDNPQKGSPHGQIQSAAPDERREGDTRSLEKK